MICDEDPTSLLPLDSSGSDVVFVVNEYSGLGRSVSTLSFYGWAGRHDVCLDLKKSAWLGEFDLMLRRGASGRLTSSVCRRRRSLVSGSKVDAHRRGVVELLW